MRYRVRVNGQALGELERSEIERRSVTWKKAGALAEVAAHGGTFVPIDVFLQTPPAPPIPQPVKTAPPVQPPHPSIATPPQPAAPVSPSDQYEVRFGTQTLRGLSRSDIETRAPNWARSNFQVSVAPSGTQQFVPLAVFLQSQPAQSLPPPPPPKPTPRPWWPPDGRTAAMAAVSILIIAAGAYWLWPTDASRYRKAIELKQAGEYEQAARLFEKIDSPAAEFNLAMLYANGQGVAQDDGRAVELLTRSADGGEPAAQTALGIRHATGEGVSANPQTAFELYTKAANQGYGWAQMLLGLAYATGTGVEQSFVEADTWFVLAAAGGDPTAAEQRDYVESLLTESERRAATERANAIAERLLKERSS